MSGRPGFQPKTYEEWLSELNFSTKPEEMISAALMAAKLSPNKKAATHDVSLVLANMYKREVNYARGQTMVIKRVGDKFEFVSQKLFKRPFSALLDYIKRSEPEFDHKATSYAKGAKAPGFIKADSTYDNKGNERKPLGFVAPKPRVDDKGSSYPGLGYLEDDGGINGSLGFL